MRPVFDLCVIALASFGTSALANPVLEWNFTGTFVNCFRDVGTCSAPPTLTFDFQQDLGPWDQVQYTAASSRFGYEPPVESFVTFSPGEILFLHFGGLGLFNGPTVSADFNIPGLSVAPHLAGPPRFGPLSFTGTFEYGDLFAASGDVTYSITGMISSQDAAPAVPEPACFLPVTVFVAWIYRRCRRF